MHTAALALNSATHIALARPLNLMPVYVCSDLSCPCNTYPSSLSLSHTCKAVNRSPPSSSRSSFPWLEDRVTNIDSNSTRANESNGKGQRAWRYSTASNASFPSQGGSMTATRAGGRRRAKVLGDQESWVLVKVLEGGCRSRMLVLIGRVSGSVEEPITHLYRSAIRDGDGKA